MTVLSRWRVARKPHKCSFCGETIQPGERYAAVALTPRDGEIGNDTWWNQASHGLTGDACPDYWRNDRHPYAEYPEIMLEGQP